MNTEFARLPALRAQYRAREQVRQDREAAAAIAAQDSREKRHAFVYETTLALARNSMSLEEIEQCAQHKGHRPIALMDAIRGNDHVGDNDSVHLAMSEVWSAITAGD